MRTRLLVMVLSLACVCPAAFGGRTLREYARLKGQNEYKLQGLGLVVGLNGTGDSGKDLVLARPLAEVLRRLGNELPSLEDLEGTRAVAIVMVTAHIPRAGAEEGDKIDVDVAVLHSASSLEGGILLTAPLTSPVRPQEVFALAGGRVSLADPAVPTVGSVRRGADVVRRVDTTPEIGARFEVVIDQTIAGWGVAATIAGEINQQYLLTARRDAEPLAVVRDPRTILVRVPEAERASPAAFVGDVMATDISSALRSLPARVICDTRSGIILLTGDVQVEPAVITHRDLTITTTVPEPIPSPIAPVLERRNFAAVSTEDGSADAARLDDLIDAFDQLDITAKDQIEILTLLHQAGKLNAKLIVDGVER